ncbi:hypothetical protein CERSUDRAFT_91866 [Gelatoporia subvermispora B]|uniref:ribonuclease H n=1 Tax=Ceriporiopsis subvermispora (strain B) TaxID=914234 RepID=M2RRN7_CERS8|nr:hypothetical protein CERSUDRAFT_91866 [Gelatoporia subvermispora B]
MSQPVVDAEGVVGRRFQFCPWIEGWAEGQDDFMITCPRCSEFAARCCQHYKYESEKSCHHYRIVFTDGACLSNGKSHATAGIGSAIGATDAEFHQWSIPIDDSVDCFPKQSNQRAELLAAIYGLRLLSDARSNGDVEDDHEHETAQVLSGHMEDKPYWVVTTDSEYVVKGMTEWLPRWKVWCLLFSPILVPICENLTYAQSVNLFF